MRQRRRQRTALDRRLQRAPRLPRVSATRQPLDALAVAAMVVLTALWGFQQVAVKLAAPGVSLLMQSALRSGIAAALVLCGHVAPDSIVGA